MTSFKTVLGVLAIGFILAMVCGCDEEFWFNADGSGRNRTIFNEQDIKFLDPDGKKGFDKSSKEIKEIYGKTKVRVKTSRDVVFGKTRWILDLEYDSTDQLSWIDDKKEKHDDAKWKMTTEPNGDLKYKYKEKLEGKEVGSGGFGAGTPRQVTVHLPGRIITSNADTVDEKKHIAVWDIATHKSITPTVVVRLPPKKKDAK